MSCFPCLKGPAAAGTEDTNKPGAYQIKVRLSTGLEIRVVVLPEDTAATVKRKVEVVHGVQPKVSVKGQLVDPPLCAQWNSKWLPIAEQATMRDIGLQKQLKFADITDQLSKVKMFSHVHWAGSHFIH